MADSSDALDPQLVAAIEAFEAEGLPAWHSLSVESARRLEDEVFGPGDGPSMRTVRDIEIDGPGGAIPIRVYVPAATDPATLVFYHGGGWTLGTLDSAEDICRELAARTGCVVCSVDYRLAPEHPFPAAVDDAYAALVWASEHAGAFGADPARLGVAGTSAGGNLAAATALRVANADTLPGGDGDPPSLAVQCLLYPVTDCSFDTASYREHGDGPLLTEADMRWFWEQYLRSPIDAQHPYASVLNAPSLAGVAPAIVVTAGHDVLRDEGASYADRLAAADVPVDHQHHPTLAHGLLSLTDTVDRADGAMDDVAEALTHHLG